MTYLSPIPRSIVKVCLGLLLSLAVSIGILTVHQRSVSAQSINTVSAEVSSLNSRVNQLENEVRQLSRLVSQTKKPSPPSSSQRVDKKNPDRAVEPSDPMFDRLATLAIELKERIDELEKRMNQLEKKALPERTLP